MSKMLLIFVLLEVKQKSPTLIRMKTVTVDMRLPKPQKIEQMLMFKDEQHDGVTRYKKTQKDFLKSYGIPLKDAPMIFEDEECLWGLFHSEFKLFGKIYEKVEYLPVISTKGIFKHLSFKRFHH